MSNDVLMIATLDGAERCARAIAEQTGSRVEVAADRKAGLLALRRAEFAVVVVEESLVEADPGWADLLWTQAGLALPLQVNLAITGAGRLAREVKAALSRREGEQALARKLVATEMEKQLRTSVTGLLLESELLLRDLRAPATLEPKLRHLVELAGNLRERLREAATA